MLAGALVLLTALSAAACGGPRPTPSPGGIGVILPSLARRGAVITRVVGGEAGCADPGLQQNAARVTLTLEGSGPFDLYVFTFRARAYEVSAAPVDACQAAFAAASGTDDVARLDVPPYRVFGPRWSPEVRSLLEGALREASQGGPDSG